ncbi:MAG: hypothetical protein Q8R98_04290 [Rubrivivax sp.]|nr:hypothetical protein [Rubrivivax sp.]MDP3611048.1 hypothetical protein [Rubrivivax sp.]
MGLAALLDDYLFVGPLMKRRLELQVPDIPVDVCETADQILAADKRAQLLQVMYAGDRFVESDDGRASRASQVVHQRYLVCVALNHVGQEKDSRHLRAGPLMSLVHKALAGWTPDGAARPFVRANAALRPQITPQKAIYPMGFEISLTL